MSDKAKKATDTVVGTLGVALVVCLVCAVIVSSAAVFLKPAQDANILEDKQRNILAAAGLLDASQSVSEQFKRVQEKIVNLETGNYVDSQEYAPCIAVGAKSNQDCFSSFDQLGEEDKVKINQRENYAVVYVIENKQQIDKVILPIRGYGLWSTLYGFIALEADGNTIAGLGFYDQKETPGLGGEVDNPKWKALWPGKKLYNQKIASGGVISIELLKGKVDPNRSGAIYQVDGLSGATLTTKGVHNLVRFWMGKSGFGPYLAKIQSGDV